VLKKNGIIITQATLSRDLSELGAVKKRLNNGRLVYLLPKNQDNNAQLKIAKKAIKDFVTDVEPVSNQVVIKTTTAAAQVIADSVDNLYIEEIIGSIAGDNVVLIITPSEVKAKKVAEIINNNLQ
jgi:transcriptional regulator of arginine metabolism